MLLSLSLVTIFILLLLDSITKSNNYIAGANKHGYHVKNINIDEDFSANIIQDIAQIPEKAKCAKCESNLYFKKAIEVGHIFKLGTIYSEKFDANYLNAMVNSVTPVEGGLVLFPSYLDHSVNENLSDDERIVISFNVTLSLKST